jgi:hypothetical protein
MRSESLFIPSRWCDRHRAGFGDATHASRRLLAIVVVVTVIGACTRPGLEESPFAGTWILKYQGRHLLSLTISVDRQRISGSFLRPTRFQYDQDGDFTAISADHKQEPVVEPTIVTNRLEFATGIGTDRDKFAMTLIDPDHARLVLVDAPLPPMSLERARPGDRDIAVWPEQHFTDDVVDLRATLKRITDEDQDVRTRPPLSPTEVAAVDRRHRPEIDRIHEQYGWLKASVAGKDAAHMFWLLVQHQDAELQRRLLPEMEREVSGREASRADYALLYDRVMIAEGKLQRWGSQTKCVDGKAVLDPVEDPSGLDERRRALFMQPVDQYLGVIAEMVCRRPANTEPQAR